MECGSETDRLFLQHMKNIRDAVLALCDCFLVRANDKDDDPLWKRFYCIQMSSYLVSKRNLDVSAPEGDMVHDLIRDTWKEVKTYMQTSKFGPVSNVDQWFKTIRIDFPIDSSDPKCTFFHQEIYYLSTCMGQKATKKNDTPKAVSN